MVMELSYPLLVWAFQLVIFSLKQSIEQLHKYLGIHLSTSGMKIAVIMKISMLTYASSGFKPDFDLRHIMLHDVHRHLFLNPSSVP